MSRDTIKVVDDETGEVTEFTCTQVAEMVLERRQQVIDLMGRVPGVVAVTLYNVLFCESLLLGTMESLGLNNPRNRQRLQHKVAVFAKAEVEAMAQEHRSKN